MDPLSSSMLYHAMNAHPSAPTTLGPIEVPT
jgi:hypothetical protein